jgi:hypothetical protein
VAAFAGALNAATCSSTAAMTSNAAIKSFEIVRVVRFPTARFPSTKFTSYQSFGIEQFCRRALVGVPGHKKSERQRSQRSHNA